MNVVDFIESFIKGTLKRKKQCGNYRVLDGEHCQVITVAGQSRGEPTGSRLLCVRLDAEEPLALFCTSGLTGMDRPLKKQINELFPTLTVLPEEILNSSTPDILESGLVDIDTVNKRALIELGSTPWVLEHLAPKTPTEQEIQSLYKSPYNFINKIPHRVATLAEAMAFVEKHDIQVILFNLIMEPLPEGTVPNVVPPHIEKDLNTSINPLDYGFAPDECAVNTRYAGSSMGNVLTVESAVEGDPRFIAFTKAVAKYAAAIKFVQATRPHTLNEVTQADNKSSNGFRWDATNKRMFMKGSFRNSTNYYQMHELKGWHQVVGKSQKIDLRTNRYYRYY